MRAITQFQFGGPEVLEIREMDRPTPIPTEVLVRVKAIGLNPIETLIRSGTFPLLGQPPFILGWDISGIVEESVPGVTRFKVGDEVYGMPHFPRQAGAYAEFVTAPSRQLALKPRTIDHVHAAALPLVGITAYQSLIDVAEVSAEKRVLIHGGGGGFGHVAVQIAKAVGAYVITTASAAKREFVQSLGADEIVDYDNVDFSTVISDVDVVIETVGKGYAQRSLPTLRKGGVLVTIVERTNQDLARIVEGAGRRFAGVSVEPDYVALERLSELVDRGKVRIHVDRTFPLERVSSAHERLTGRTMGKLVLTT